MESGGACARGWGSEWGGAVLGKNCLIWKKRDVLDKERVHFLLSLDATYKHKMLRDAAVWGYTRKVDRIPKTSTQNLTFGVPESLVLRVWGRWSVCRGKETSI